MRKAVVLFVVSVFVAGFLVSCEPDTDKEKKPPVPEGGKIISKGGWHLVIAYRAKGTKSEGQEGKLYRGLIPIPGAEGQELDTPLGKMKYYGDKYVHLWDPTGWNYADKAQIEKNASKHH
jgi:hypothetical protein